MLVNPLEIRIHGSETDVNYYPSLNGLKTAEHAPVYLNKTVIIR